MGVEHQDLLQAALTVATEAAELVQRTRASAISDVDTKSSETDVVTAADKAAEQLIRDRLAQLRPGEPVLGEEGGADGTARAGGVCWVVDPIDGTVNYLYGYPQYSVSVAAQIDGESAAGVVVEPVSGRQWAARLGGGATLNGAPLHVSRADSLELSLIATGFAYDRDRRRRQAQLVAGLLGKVRDIRRGGSAALDLCAVAAGWVDGYVEHGLSRWDWAAGALIAREAGAVVSLPGDGERFGKDGIVAATPGIAEEFAAALVSAGVRDI